MIRTYRFGCVTGSYFECGQHVPIHPHDRNNEKSGNAEQHLLHGISPCLNVPAHSVLYDAKAFESQGTPSSLSRSLLLRMVHEYCLYSSKMQLHIHCILLSVVN